MCFSNCTVWASFRGKISKGNKLYNKNKFDQALKMYEDAQIKNRSSEELNFNIGNAFYKKCKFENAHKEYEKAAFSKNPQLKAKAYYNMGNALYRQGKLNESISSYKQALDITPEDEDAKYNIEFVQKKLKELRTLQEKIVQEHDDWKQKLDELDSQIRDKDH